MVRGRRNPLHLGIPERLKKSRHAAKLTRASLASKANMFHSVIKAIEEEGRIPAIDTVEHLARALAVTPCWLAFGQLGKRTFGSGRFPASEQHPDDPQPASTMGPLTCEGVGQRMVRARERMSLSMRALARAAEVAPMTVSNIEEGRSLPSVETAEKLAGALGVSPCWLAYDEGQGPGGG